MVQKHFFEKLIKESKMGANEFSNPKKEIHNLKQICEKVEKYDKAHGKYSKEAIVNKKGKQQSFSL